MKTKQVALTGLLIALALVLSYLESLVPMSVAVPGVKLGLANTVTLFALYRLNIPMAVLILIARCLLGMLFSGNVSALAFSVTGGLLAMGAMALAKKSRHLSVWGVSVLGAAGHNCGQILTAALLMHSPYIIGYLPYLLTIGTVCGCATAAVAYGVLRSLKSFGRIH